MPVAARDTSFDADRAVALYDVDGVRRRVEVTYPRWYLRPGYSLHPVLAICVGLFWIGLGGSFILAMHSTTPDLAAAVDGGVFYVGMLLVFAIIGLRGAVEVVLGASDLFFSRTTTGQIVKVWRRVPKTPITGPNGPLLTIGLPEKPYVAVADGSAARVRAVAIDATKLRHVRPGDVVTLRYTPRLEHVRHIDTALGRDPEVPLPPPPPGSAAVSAHGLAEVTGIDLDEIFQLTGVGLHVIRAESGAGVPTKVQLAASPSGSVTVRLEWGRTKWLGRAHQVTVDGAEDARWMKSMSTLAVSRGHQTLSVKVELPGSDDGRKQRVAIAVATSFLRNAPEYG